MAETTTQKLSRNKINRAPTTELGAVLGGAFSPAGMAPWTRYVDDSEYVPELKWPKSVEVYERMSTDTQLAALYSGTVLPIRHFNWQLDPNEAPDNIVQKLAADYNLPILGEEGRKQPKRRTKKRFSFKDHLRKALYAGKYGHYFFEQVGDIQDDGLWHLRKLAERPPKTIQNILVAPDGGLISIAQNVSPGMDFRRPAAGYLPEIPVDRLVGYVWEQEGADWTGRSWFRECYRNWLIKDRLMRIDATNHEKAGGIIYGVAPQGSTPAEQQRIQEMSSEARVGMTSGMGLPAGTDLNILRAAGSDVVESMRYHDESMARRFLLMVMQLGQTQTGSRALGSTFVDFFGQGLTAIADWFGDVFCEHVIEDDVDYNWENVEVVPRITYNFDPELAITDLVQLIEAGAIVVDDDLETELRRELALPAKGTPRPKNPVPDPIAEDPNVPDEPSPDQVAPAPGTKAERQEEGGEAPSSPPKPGVKTRLRLGRRKQSA